MDRGKWSQQGVPHKGWQFSHLIDLGDLVRTCEMCETRSIRYVHYMEHPDYDDVLRVGSACAGKMEEDYEAAKERDKNAKSKASRQRDWMNAPWKESQKGNSYINRKGYNIVLYQKSGCWAYIISERKGDQSWPGSDFATKDAAKLAAFNRYVEL